MSGPKTSSYRINSAEIRRQRAERRREEEQRRQEELRRFRVASDAVEKAEAQLSRLELEIANARKAHPDETVHVAVARPAAPRLKTIGGLESYLRELETTLFRVRQELDLALNTAQSNLAMRRIIESAAERHQTSPPSARSVGVQSSAPASADTQQRVRRLMSQLDELSVDGNTLQRIKALGEQALAAKAGQAEALEITLRGEVQKVLLDAQEWRRERDAAEKYLLDLMNAGAVDDYPLARELQDILAGRRRLTAQLRQQVAKEIENRQRVEDERYVGDSVRNALSELGYNVGPEFSTLFVEGGETYVQRSDWGDYFFALNVDREDSEFNFRVVRKGDDAPLTIEQQRIDRAKEEELCKEVPAIVEKMAAAGVVLGSIRSLAPGSLPVQAIPSISGTRAERKRSRTSLGGASVNRKSMS